MQLPGDFATGIVSEIRVGRLLSSENNYLKYPIDVVVHVIERTTKGELTKCTVNTGEGSWITAAKANFEFISKEIPNLHYQKIPPNEMKTLVQNILIYNSEKLTNANKIGVFD